MQSRDSIENTLLALEDDWDALEITDPNADHDDKQATMLIGYNFDMLSEDTKVAMLKTFEDQLNRAVMVRADLEKYQQRLVAIRRAGGLDQKQQARLGTLTRLTTIKLAASDSGIRSLTHRNQTVKQRMADWDHRPLVVGYDYDMLSTGTKEAMLKRFEDQLEAADLERDDLEKYQQRLLATKRIGGLNKKQRIRLRNLIERTTTKVAAADSGIRSLSQRNRALVQRNQAETRRLTRLALAQKEGRATDAFLLRNYVVDPEGLTDIEKTREVADIVRDRHDPLGPGRDPILDFGVPIGASMQESEMMMMVVGAKSKKFRKLSSKRDILVIRQLAVDRIAYYKTKKPNLSKILQDWIHNQKTWRKNKRMKGINPAILKNHKSIAKQTAKRYRKAKKETKRLDKDIRIELGVIKAADIRLKTGEFSKSQFLASGSELALIGAIELRKRWKEYKAGRTKSKGYGKIKEGKKEVSEGARREAAIKKATAREKARQTKAAKKETKKLKQKAKKSRQAIKRKYNKKRRADAQARSKQAKFIKKEQRKQRRAIDRKASKKRRDLATTHKKKRKATRDQEKKDRRSSDKQHKPQIRRKEKEFKKASKAQKEAEKEYKKARKEAKPTAEGLMKNLWKSASLSRHPTDAANSYEDTVASEDHAIDSFQELLAQKILDPLSLQSEVEDLGMDAEDHEYLHDLFYDYAQEALNTVRPRTGPTADPVLTLHNVSHADTRVAFDLVAQDIGEELKHGWQNDQETVRAWHTSHAALKAWLTAIKHQQNWEAHTDPALARTKHIGSSSDTAFAIQPAVTTIQTGIRESTANATKAGKSFAAALNRFFSHIPGYGLNDATV